MLMSWINSFLFGCKERCTHISLIIYFRWYFTFYKEYVNNSICQKFSNLAYRQTFSKKQASKVTLVMSSKVRPWGRCSKYIRQQRTRLYIIWRCTVLLLCWHE
ncbi:hypothetical protein GYH30_007305 [Glycine max]|uniref:Uncharacterized protein n=2 Tax=Glycine subgen. Soja TaxID=1462606 RepID=K7KF72_SOYBN|nr:hypothetical protein GYH30_007305 [Glycine max]RZC20788.1 hypothetical protein D0Y65_007233 [Glycine soja]